MVGKLSDLRDLLHKLADFITDLLDLLKRIRDLFGKDSGVNDETVEEEGIEDLEENKE